MAYVDELAVDDLAAVERRHLQAMSTWPTPTAPSHTGVHRTVAADCVPPWGPNTVRGNPAVRLHVPGHTDDPACYETVDTPGTLW